MKNNNDNSIATLTHLSVFLQYFFPFANFIAPIVVWSTLGKKSEFVNHHSKQVINFQLSLFLYSVIMLITAIPFLLLTVLKNLKVSHLSGDEDFYIQNLDIANLTGIALLGMITLLLFLVLKAME